MLLKMLSTKYYPFCWSLDVSNYNNRDHIHLYFSGSVVFWLSPNSVQRSRQCDCWWCAVPTLGWPTGPFHRNVWRTLGLPRYKHSCGGKLLQEPGSWHLAMVFYRGSRHPFWLLFCRRSGVSSGWWHLHWYRRNKHFSSLDNWEPHSQFEEWVTVVLGHFPNAVNNCLVWALSLRHNVKKEKTKQNRQTNRKKAVGVRCFDIQLSTYTVRWRYNSVQYAHIYRHHRRNCGINQSLYSQTTIHISPSRASLLRWFDRKLAVLTAPHNMY